MNAPFDVQAQADKTHEHARLFDAAGKLLLERRGDIDSVTFSEAELQQAVGGTLVHSHPLGKPPSGADLTLAARYGLRLQIVGTTPDGQSYEYLVKMPGPSPHRAEFLETAFDHAVDQARETMPGDMNIWAHEREARHQAVTRLAQEYGFEYARLHRNASISEASRVEQKRLDVLGSLPALMSQEVFEPLHAQISKTLLRYMDETGHIPVERLAAAQRAASGQIVQVMLGRPLQGGALAPYTVQGDQVVPRSPYFRALWGAMHQAADAAVERHASIMRRYLPDDLIRLLEAATDNPFSPAVQEMDEPPEDNPFPVPQYDPLHLWVGEGGKQLSDRIWDATGEMRRKLDRYLAEAIASRKPVQQMAQELEDFLLPERKLIRTTRGYGTDLSFDALRLARTEVSAAFHRADSAAAQLDPFVETYTFFTAPQHQCCDNCDDVAAGSPYPKDDLVHLPPQHPHCICGVFWNVVKNTQNVVERLRDLIQRGIHWFIKQIGPLSKRFVGLLFRGRL